MKVVLFCGGQGMRLREFSDKVPKPMVPIGYRPLLWYVMKYYAHYGHKDFILCLGHQADVIKNYFVNYHEYESNDFVYSKGGNNVSLLNSDIDDWTITFVDTGVNANIGQRLKAVQKHLNGEDMFLANYSDGLTNLYLPEMIQRFQASQKTGMFMTTQPTRSFHVVSLGDHEEVKSINPLSDTGMWINAGYFIFKQAIFDYIEAGEELVEEPFQRMIARHELAAYPYRGFWQTMDTFKEKQLLDDMYTKGDTPWQVWKNSDTNEQSPRLNAAI